MEFFDAERKLTRRERYAVKQHMAKSFPVSITTVSFDQDVNLALLIRGVSCFGGQEVNVIGRLPPYAFLKAVSGSTIDLIKINQFSSPLQFLSWSRENGVKLVSAELTDGANNIYDYKFDYKVNTSIVIGNETRGVETEILLNSDKVYIPMGGGSYCLNAAMAGTVILSEYFRNLPQGR